MKNLLAFIFIFLVCGCYTTASNMNYLSPGMTKQEVVNTIGMPDSAKFSEGVEVLEYVFPRYKFNPAMRFQGQKVYWIFLINNKVTSYYKAGDFGSAEIPTTKHVLEQKIKSQEQIQVQQVPYYGP